MGMSPSDLMLLAQARKINQQYERGLITEQEMVDSLVQVFVEWGQA
jgi:hypothetical protein